MNFISYALVLQWIQETREEYCADCWDSKGVVLDALRDKIEASQDRCDELHR